MRQREKDALIGYLEFHLLNFCEQLEKDLDPDAIGPTYDSAYAILSDMEHSIQDIIDIDNASKVPMKKS